MTDKFDARAHFNGESQYTFQKSKSKAREGVIRCANCNKFMSFQKFCKNDYKCYHWPCAV